MDSSDALKHQTPEEIRGQIDQNREALGDKLGALGEKMEDAKTAVAEKMEDAKSAVAETVEHVKEKLSLQHHVRENPWTAFFGAVGVGLVAGHMLASSRHSEPVAAPAKAEGPGLFSLASGAALGGMFDQEIKSALTSALQAVWGEAKQNVPSSIAGPVDRLLERMSLRQGSLTHLGSLRAH